MGQEAGEERNGQKFAKFVNVPFLSTAKRRSGEQGEGHLVECCPRAVPWDGRGGPFDTYLVNNPCNFE
jgi:hypothetical protein